MGIKQTNLESALIFQASVSYFMVSQTRGGECDTVIYNKRYIFGLCPPSWQRAPKAQAIS